MGKNKLVSQYDMTTWIRHNSTKVEFVHRKYGRPDVAGGQPARVDPTRRMLRPASLVGSMETTAACL
jgi:hypothetical protein